VKSDLHSTGSSRRELLKGAAGIVAAALTGGSLAQRVQADTTPTARRRSLRIAHMTDIHVRPEHRGAEGMTACLHHIQQHARPDLILNTGDTIVDSMYSEESRVKMLWDLSQRIWKSECSLPVEHAIGNHDIWGINKARSKTTGTEPLYGKKWIMSLYGWQRTYRSFDRNGWHFVALDSAGFDDKGYHGHIDDEQIEWLNQDLKRVPSKTPILLFCHIPILSAAAFFKGSSEKSGDWVVPEATMVLEARKMKDLFYKYPNVKLCLSGHLHLVDRVDYLGVSYLCGGAVSGNRWRGSFQECEPGYGVVDLYDDGSSENQYVTYGWKAQA